MVTLKINSETLKVDDQGIICGILMASQNRKVNCEDSLDGQLNIKGI